MTQFRFLRSVHYLSTMIIAATSFCTVASPAPANASPPAFDGEHIAAYRIALNASHDAQSIRIRHEIERGPADWAIAREAAMKAGVRLTIGRSHVSTRDNAEPLYESWYASQRANPSKYRAYEAPLTFRYQLTSAEINHAKEVNQAHRTDLAILETALGKPSYSCGASADDEPTRHLYKLTFAARQITTNTTLLAHEGRWSDAITEQAKCFLVVRHLAQEPGLISYLSACTMDINAIYSMQSILGQTAPNARLALQVENIVERSRGCYPMNSVMNDELALSLGDFDRSECCLIDELAKDTAHKINPAEDVAFVRSLTDAAKARHVASLLAAYRAMRESGQKRTRDLQRQFDRETNIVAQSGNDPIYTNFLIDPTPYGLIPNDAQLRIARERVCMAGPALLAAKARTGTFPCTLPAEMIDPYSGKSLQYRKSGKGFIVYSVGPTGCYDGSLKPHIGSESSFRYPADPPKALPQNMLQSWP